MSKLAIIFPGIGYTPDKPLLIYSAKLASNAGYQVTKIHFTDPPEVVPGNRASMLAAFEHSARQTEEALEGIKFDSYEDVIFISKSIGTIAAAAYVKKHALKARHIYFTPLAQTFSFVESGNGIVFHGTNDPWAEHENIMEAIKQTALQSRIYKGADHSLETGDVHKDIELLGRIMDEADDYIRG